MKKVSASILALYLFLPLLVHNLEGGQQQTGEGRNVKINYFIVGEGMPIIMLHDFGVDHRQMKGCMESLFRDKPGWKRVYIDLPGMGNSEAKEWVNNSDKVLEIISSLIENLIPKQHFALAGHSYGAYLARAIAQEKGELVDGILMIAPITVTSSENRKLPRRVLLSSDPKLISGLKLEDAKLFESQVVLQNDKTWHRFSEDILPGINAANPEFLMKLRGLGFAFSFDINKVRIVFEKPALIITGRQDHIVGYQDAFELLDFYPRAEFIVLDGAGHNLQFEQEEVFNFCVNRWLNKIEQALPSEFSESQKESGGVIDVTKQKQN